MSVEWVEVLRRSGLTLDVLAEALYDAAVAGRTRLEAPPWLAAPDHERLIYRRLAKVAVDRLARIEDPLLEQLLDTEGKLREQLELQARTIAELQKRGSG